MPYVPVGLDVDSALLVPVVFVGSGLRLRLLLALADRLGIVLLAAATLASLSERRAWPGIL